MIGPGKYDATLAKVLKEIGSREGLLIIFNGGFGAGMSCQLSLETMKKLPLMYRQLADEIEKEIKIISGGNDGDPIL